MQKTKRQHTVPRCYLKRFIDPAKGTVWTFDKHTKRVYDASEWNVAQERYFYDFHPEAIKPEHRASENDLQAVEKGLAAIEGYLASTLEALLDRRPPMGIPPGFRKMLAVQVAIQWMRTKRYRDSMMELSRKYFQAQVDDLMRHRFPDVPQRLYPIAEVKETSVSAMHGQFFFNQERWEQVAAGLINKIWMLAVNDTGKPFYTSDHPVVRRANLPDDKTGGIGLNSPGVEFFMPLSPKYGLLMLERNFFRSYWPCDRGRALFTQEQAEVFNRLQVEQSHRHVFSSTDDFTTAEKVCVECPAACAPNRETAEVIVSEVDPTRTRFEVRVRP